MKICRGCKIEKDLIEFNYKNKGKGIFQSQCKECTRVQVKRHYYKNQEYYLTKARKRNKNDRVKKREFIWAYLSQHPCVDCQERDITVLTFDHKENKLCNVSEMVGFRFSLTQIKSEIAKCEVRCANCHLRKTARDNNWGKLLRLRSSIGLEQRSSEPQVAGSIPVEATYK